MKLFEFEAKQIFAKYGIPVPRGAVVREIEDLKRVAEKLSLPLVVKSQVLVSGRGKAGGIKFASSLEELESCCKALLHSKIKGEEVGTLLIEERVDIERELYFSITVDRNTRSVAVLASKYGGVDIEETAKKHPESIVKIRVPTPDDLYAFHARELARKLGLRGKLMLKFADIACKAFRIFKDYYADLVEMNPLVVTKNADLVAVDARIIVDDNAMFKLPEVQEMVSRSPRELSEREAVARQYGFSYVELDGDIGIMGNGAGLVMATLDMVKKFGGEPANFLDIGGGASSETVYKALHLLLTHERVKAVLVNVLGGITRCDEVATGVIRALEEANANKPIVVRLTGTFEEEGRRLLEKKGIFAYSKMVDAVREVVKLVKGVKKW